MASKAIGFLNFKFGADLGGFEKAMKKAQKKLSKFGKSVQKTGKNLTTGLTLPILALGAASIKAFDEQEKAIAQVEAGLKSTGNSVGFTSEKLQQMAADLQKTTLFGDEEILKGATAQLLTFTNITGEQFKKTQAVALDLATRLDGDLKSASIMLGKALNDPVANLSALSRAGIQFSEEQKETVKAMVETNDLAGAQTLILGELEKQYGGSAEAAAQAGLGPITQLKNQLSDLSEQIGARLIPFVKQFTTWLVGLAEKFDSLSESQKDNIVKWGLILAAVGPILIIIGKLSIGMSALIPAIKFVGFAFSGLFKIMLANPFLAIAALIAGVVLKLTVFSNAAIKARQAQEKLNAAIADRSAEQLSKNDIFEKVKLWKTLTKTQKLNLLEQIKAHKITLEDSKLQINQAGLQNEKIKELKVNIKSYQDLVKKGKGGDAFENAKIMSAPLMIKQMKDEIASLQKQISGGKSVKGFNKDINQMNSLIDELETKLSKSKEPLQDVDNVMKSLNNTFKASNNTVEESKDDIVALSLELEQFKDVTSTLTTAEFLDTKPVEAYRGALGTLVDQISVLTNISAPELEDALMSTMTKLGDNLAQGAESFQEFGESVKGMMKDIIGGIISQGIATAITAALSSPAIKINPFLIPVIAGAAAGLARTAFNSLVPAFAEGGLVTGPTTALIGEGVGTNAGNPEVVAPLDKLKSMMGGGNNSNITVTGKLIGSDIFLSNQNASNNRLRTT